jgi:hypothetical protein
LETLTAVVLSIALLLLYRVLTLALRSKGDVRAGASIAGSSFYIEVKDRKSTAKPVPEIEKEVHNRRRRWSG